MKYAALSLILGLASIPASAASAATDVLTREQETASEAADILTREEETASAEVTVDLSSTRSISPLLFGHNIEYINAAEGMCDSETAQIQQELVPCLRDLKAGILRFPGGTLSNFYHWADGIGPRDLRGKGCPDWEPKHAPAILMTFGTDDLFHFAQAIGCPAAIITANVPTEREIGGKPWMGTAPEAAAWVAYCNATPENNTVLGKDAHGTDWGLAGDWAKKRGLHGHSNPYRVQFWELGNEIFTACKDPSEYAKTCREFSKAMKAVDPSIRIGVVGNDLEFGMKESPWNQTVLRETQGSADFLVAHFYLPGIRGGGDGRLTAKDATRIALVSPDGFRRKLADLRDEINNAKLGPDFGLAITEFACNLRIETETDKRRLSLIRSQQAAVHVADTLLAFQEAGVLMSNYWALRSWEWSLIQKADNKDILQAPYFVYKLFADTWQDLFCSTTVRCGKIELNLEPEAKVAKPAYPALSAGASINPERTRLAIMLINRATDGPTAVTVRFQGPAFIGRTVHCDILTAPPDAVNTAESPDLLGITQLPARMVGSTIECQIPPCSVGVLSVECRTP